LFNSAIGAFIAVESHEGTTPFPGMDRKHPVGKYVYTRSNIYCVKLYHLAVPMQVKNRIF